MANDFVANYEEEEEEETGVERGNGQCEGKRCREKEDNQGINRLCRSIDCLNSLSEFVANRNNERLQELFNMFNEEFSNTIEKQLIKRLENKMNNKK